MDYRIKKTKKILIPIISISTFILLNNDVTFLKIISIFLMVLGGYKAGWIDAESYFKE